jgi:hypothetical protein
MHLYAVMTSAEECVADVEAKGSEVPAGEGFPQVDVVAGDVNVAVAADVAVVDAGVVIVCEVVLVEAVVVRPVNEEAEVVGVNVDVDVGAGLY